MSTKVYWWNSPLNFGDWITPYILGRFGVNFEYALLRNADLISVGSILGWALNLKYLLWYLLFRSKKIVVLGSGLMRYPKFSILHYIKFKFLDVRLVRGPLTKQAVLRFLGNNVPCGDPGLLAATFYDKPLLTVKYKVGLIPHHSSYEEFSKLSLPLDWLLIDPRTSNCDFIFESICQCQLIISQSLHGLIVSDSFQIPNIWLYSRDLHAGGDFKFRDYFLSIGRSPSLCYRVDNISEVITASDSEFSSLSFQIDSQVLHAVSSTILSEFKRYVQSELI